MKAIKKGFFILLIYIVPLNLLGQYINPGLILTFDDNSIENWHKLLPIFQKYNAKATFFITTPNIFDSIQKQMILDLHSAGNEIGSHGYYHYNCVNYSDTSSVDSYIAAEIKPSIHWFDSVLNIKLSGFAYPYGARNELVDLELLKYFKMIRGTDYSMFSSGNKISNLSNSKLVSGVGIDIGYGNSLDDIKASLTQCMNDRLIQIFYSHVPTESASGEYQISYATIDSILRHASEIGMSFYTFSDAWLPIPPTPIDDTLIIETEMLSNYYTEKNNLDVNWTISSSESGTLNYMDSIASIDWNLDFDGEVMLRAAYTNNCGQGDFSPPLKINRKIGLEIPEISVSNVNIFPNPSKGEITIIATGNTVKFIDVFNASGQVVYSTANYGDTFTLNLKNQGFYLIKIKSENVLVSKYIVIE